MKKRSMLAIASLAAGVVTALVTPPPHATAATGADGGATGTTGLSQSDAPVESLLEDAAPVLPDGGLQLPEGGPLA
ncbi:hypothetical protein [Streptomyces sp. NPDC008121]|uniref:hypothetical protein n=1 Tax=Streptomyces sp. NPDC008121 TaxID=3364809 RepID=UPI0036EF388D